MGLLERRRSAGARRGGVEFLYPRGFWATMALPGVVWIVALFLVPFYAIIATGAGRIDPNFGNAIPEWNPIYWQPDNFLWVFRIRRDRRARVPPHDRLRGDGGRVLRAARLSGRVLHVPPDRPTRNIFLLLMVLPFWVSYLMRILAWVNLLQNDGLVNRILVTHQVLEPQEWLAGHASTVVFGLIYGYMPFFILPLYASLERIDKHLVQAALDLGASPPSAFTRVTLPLSKQGILAGIAIIMLPMFGDFFTADSWARRGTRWSAAS